MGSDTVIGHGFHFFGTNLDFDGYPVHTEQGCVQGLVAVSLGNGNIILESSGNRFKKVVNGA